VQPSGAVNDRICLRVTGLVYLKAVDQSSTDLGKSGTTGGWAAEVAFSGTSDMLFASNRSSKYEYQLELHS
jgi:hypothetical protein